MAVILRKKRRPDAATNHGGYCKSELSHLGEADTRQVTTYPLPKNLLPKDLEGKTVKHKSLAQRRKVAQLSRCRIID